MDYYPPEPRERAHERVFGRMQATAFDGRHSILVVVLAVSIFIGTGAFGFWQATNPGHVQDQLEIGVAELTDIDTYIATHVPELRAEVTAGNEQIVELPGYPLPITLSRDELLETEDAALRELILQRSASMVYISGLEAFDRTGNQDLGLLTSEWWIDYSLGFVTGAWHDRARVIGITGFLVAAIAATFIFVRRPAGEGLRSTGFAVLAGAVPGLVFMAAGAYWFGRTGGDDPFVSSIAEVIESFFEVPRRTYLVVTTVGAFFAAVGYLLPMVERMLPGAERSSDPGGPVMPKTMPIGAPIREDDAAETVINEPGSRDTRD